MKLEEVIKKMLDEIDEILYLSDNIKDTEISEKMIRILEEKYDSDIN